MRTKAWLLFSTLTISSLCAADETVTPTFIRYAHRGSAIGGGYVDYLGDAESVNGLVVSTRNTSYNPRRVVEAVDTATGQLRFQSLDYGRDFRNLRLTADGRIFGVDFEEDSTSYRTFVGQAGTFNTFYPMGIGNVYQNDLSGFDVMQSGSERFVAVSGVVLDPPDGSGVTMFRNGLPEWTFTGASGSVRLDPNRNVYVANLALTKLSRRGVRLWSVFVSGTLSRPQVEVVPDDSPFGNPREPDILVYSSSQIQTVYRYSANGFLERTYTLPSPAFSPRKLRGGEVIFRRDNEAYSAIDANGNLISNLPTRTRGVDGNGNFAYELDSGNPNDLAFAIRRPTGDAIFRAPMAGRQINRISFDRYNNAGLITQIPDRTNFWTSFVGISNLANLSLESTSLRPGQSTLATVDLRFGSPRAVPSAVAMEYRGAVTGPEFVNIPAGGFSGQATVTVPANAPIGAFGVVRARYGGRSYRSVIRVTP